MKTIQIFFLNLLFLFTNCNGQLKQVEEEKPKIYLIVTNDYISERNLSFMGGPIPTNYKKEIVDSLENCFVEFYDNNNNIVQEKYYNKVGALYHSNQKMYDSKNRIEKSIEIDEFKNDTCTTNFKYTDSLNFLIHTRISTSCKNDFLDFYYKYNAKGEKIEELLYENDILIRKKVIQEFSKNERRIKSYDQANRLSNYVYKYNDNDLLIYEKRREWDYVIRGEYFKTEQENEILYKYDKNGNWIERTTQTYCLPKKHKPTKKTAKNEHQKVIEIGVYTSEDCNPEIKEKLIRKIYYK